MNRSDYFNYIEEKLNFLSYRIKNRAKINLLDLNIHSETFFAELANNLLKYDFKNANAVKHNMEAIDLIDKANKIVAQVSSTCTGQKIEQTLEREIFSKYPGFRFKFIAIAGEAASLRNRSFANPHKVNFDPREDIYDIQSLLNLALNKPIEEQRALYEFVKAELGNIVDIVKVDTNLAAIIDILSKEDWSEAIASTEIKANPNSFEIARKIEFNNLITVKSTIDEYKIFYGRLDEKYKEFDRQGANKSLSVFFAMKNQYVKLRNRDISSHELFFSIIERVIEIIRNSKNYTEIPYEELEMCVSILMVDSFIRCKTFENPEDYNHVVARQYSS
ncbi:MAG: SMEK domain-containing protein [Clostridiales Family XIII bacterium]|nr:SMEK domain-containing protein [Clostridiales Family XIII bacterium]